GTGAAVSIIMPPKDRCRGLKIGDLIAAQHAPSARLAPNSETKACDSAFGRVPGPQEALEGQLQLGRFIVLIDVRKNKCSQRLGPKGRLVRCRPQCLVGSKI